MYPAGKHPIFPYTMEEREKILEASNLNEKQLQADVEHILGWYQKQPHLPKDALTEHAIELLIIAGKGYLEKVKRRIDCLFKYRGEAPEIIQGRDKILKDFNLWKYYLQAPMPKLYEGKRIVVTLFTEPEIASQDMLSVCISSLMMADMRIANDFMIGDIWIVDLKDITMLHTIRLNPLHLHKAIKILQDGLGLRIFGIYIINCSMANIMQFILMFFKPLFNAKILSRIKFIDSYESLYKVIPKEYLPKDYGGYLPCLTDIRDEFQRVITSEKSSKLLIDAVSHVSDENRRPNDSYNEYILPGTFKKLDLD